MVIASKTLQTMKASSAESSLKPITPERFRYVMERVCPGFVIDDDNRHLINSMFYYVNGKSHPRYMLDPSKGVLLWGPVGTGKSTIIRILGELLRLHGQGYATINCSYLATQYATKGLEALNSSTINETEIGIKPVNRAFDELGREPVPAKYYGNDLNVMQYIFQCRYEIRDRVKTFATTNLRPDGLTGLYGQYIADRIGEMFTVVELKGKSRRIKSH